MSPLENRNYVRFSQSTLWKEQSRFYKEAGIDAWNGDVPHLITNNLTFAHSYANVILRFFQEYTSRQHVSLEPDPFIIVELGAGLGMFAFYLIKELLELRKSLNRSDLKFKYIMTDFSAQNIAYWRNHPALRQFVRYCDEELLDFAEYAIGETSTLHLLESGLDLNHSTYGSEHAKPWVVIANYVFDTLPQDIFEIRDGRLLEGLTPETVPDTHEDNTLQNDPKSLRQLGINIEYYSIQLPYYNNKHFDTILSSYKDRWRLPPNMGFLFPIATLKGIHNLLGLSGQNLILLATDKASTYYPTLVNEEGRVIDFHGASFSIRANFHAIRAFFQLTGGKSLDQPIPEGITTSLFLGGKEFKSFYETEQSFSTFFINYDPCDLMKFCWKLENSVKTSGTGELLSYLNLMRWDPEAIDRNIKTIIAKTKGLHAIELKSFIEGMHRCGDYFYYLPGSLSKFVNIATFFQEISDFATSLEYYQQAFKYCGKETASTCKHIVDKIAMCHERLGT